VKEAKRVLPIDVLVASISLDVKAEVIAASVAARPDMNLLESRFVTVAEVDAILESVSPSSQCALVLIGPSAETDELAERWLTERADLVVLHVDVVDDIVRIALRDPSLDSLLSALRGLVEHVGGQRQERVARFQLRSVRPPAEAARAASDHSHQDAPQRPLLHAAIDWMHKLLRDAVERVSDENGDVHGFSVTRATLLQSLDEPSERDPNDKPSELAEADAALDLALAAADAKAEPLAAAARVFGLGPLEFRMMVLALAPELDHRFQRCMGFLLDEMGRRVGTMGLYSTLLGAMARVRGKLAESGALARWRVFEGDAGRQPAADEPLRLDPFLSQWLLGERSALADDPRVRRLTRLVPWPGASLLQRREERTKAARLMARLKGPGAAQWVLLGGDDPAGWRALLDLGANVQEVAPVRAEPTRLAGVDVIEIEECARRVGRMTQLTGGLLVVDVTKADGGEGEDDWMRSFFATLSSTGCQTAVICRDEARILRLLGPASYETVDELVLTTAARVAALRAAAAGADAYLSEESAEAMANRYPLHLDGLEHAMRRARSQPVDYDADDPRLARFTEACKQVAAEGVSHLAERIEPIFSLDDVVLPPDRKRQLVEIVDNVRLAPRVLDGWKFRDQLPYGRGVAALFHGSSGTGKTMAAMGIARTLGIQLLRLDFSKVVSKYIGDTEKNIDRAFTDAQRSGAAILIDEADALLGRRSEVKDAHDRYANIEVAYLLQRMEAYEGLAILTTNQRQNLDPAFLRRLRFVIDFPRPDVDAREQIWRQCLPGGSHELDDAAFRQLARKVDLTGGHIRQITLRAAFIAAAAGVQIGLEHIVQAARAEFAKLGMPPAAIDVSQARKVA
jgi:SpoVK/Ycf46/Vps4 family AAA+-type ATPase